MDGNFWCVQRLCVCVRVCVYVDVDVDVTWTCVWMCVCVEVCIDYDGCVISMCCGTNYLQGKKFEFSIQKLSNLLSFAL